MTIIATLNEILFPVFLFLVIFCFLICLTCNQQNQSCEEIERIDNFTTEIKEAFSTQFDPEPESEVKEPIIITQDNQRMKANNKRISLLNNNTNPQNLKPSNQPTKPDFSAMKVKELKQYIRELNLQSDIKSICGKSFSKCTKIELIRALS